MTQHVHAPSRRGRRVLGRLVPVLVTLAVITTLLTVGGSSSTPFRPSADLTQFRAGNIISDEVFYFGNALATPQIQAFIDEKGANCVTGTDGTPCLRVYTQTTTSRPADTFCSGYTGAAGESAATIVAKVAQSCNINPKVLLVMLEKERGLIRASGPNLTSGDYRIAMGYGCPDTAPCDAAYYGFQNQVYMAAWQMQRYTKNSANYAYRSGRTVNIQWHPNGACGSAPVYIENQATAALYNYTPYQPNGAALGQGGSTSCSSYGNRNFWAYFTDWFISTQSDAVAKASPKGVVDSLVETRTGFTSSGWAFDPDAPVNPLTVRATVNGAVVASVTAAAPRPDVAAAYGVGPDHGFAISGLLAYGTHNVCLVAENLTGKGVTVQLGCKTITFEDRAPVVNVDRFEEQADGSVVVSGWAFDPDGTAPELHVYANGRGRAATTTVPRADVQAIHPVAGPNAGFAITLGPFSTRQDVCLFGVDVVAPGNNWLVGCRTYEYRSPLGVVDDVSETRTGGLRISGWTLDPSLPTLPLQVHAYVNDRGTSFQASGPREDIGRAFPGAGPSHGFDVTVPAGPGQNRVCVFGINAGIQGVNPLLGCRIVTLQYTAPEGVVDSVASVGDGRVRVSGWVLDRSVPTASVDVHHYVDGRWYGAVTAADRRTDIAAAFPGAGAAHGFSTTLDVGAGPHQVCTFAINVGIAGTNPLLGCRSVTVTDRPPIGSVDSVVRSAPGEVRVNGWTFDPDAPKAPATVRVSVDGVDVGDFPASAARPDVGRIYPEAGPDHGFSIAVPAAPGDHDVCVSALSTGVGGTPKLLRCARVTV